MDRSRELVLRGRTGSSAEAWLRELEDLLLELKESTDPAAAGADRGFFRFWILLLLAEHRGLDASALEDARAVLHSIAPGREASFGQYWCVRIAAEHFGAGQLDEVEYVADFGLTQYPSQPFYAQELWKLRARAALEEGLTADAQEHLRSLERSLAESKELSAQDRSQLRARAEGEWALFWMDLGVLDRAGAHLDRAEELAGASGGSIPELRLLRADYLLLSEEFERLEHEIAGWTGEGALDARLASLLELYRGIAQSEAEREDASRKKEAETTLRGLLQRSRASDSDDSQGLTPRERAKIWIELADLSLRAAEHEGAARALAEARRILERSDARATGELALLVSVYEAELALARGASREGLASLAAELQSCYDGLLESWSNSIHPPGGIGFLHMASRRQVLSALVELTLRAEPEGKGVESALDQCLRAQALGTLSRELGTETDATTLPAVRSFLTERHGVLVYLPSKLENTSHLFAFDRERILHVHLPSRDRLRKAIAPLEESLAVHPATLDVDLRSFHGRRLERQASAVAELVLPRDLRPWLAEWKVLTVVGAELLGTVPFECLPLADGRMLGQALAVYSLASLPVGLALARRSVPDLCYDFGLVAHLGLDPELRANPIVSRAKVAEVAFEEADRRRLCAGFAQDRVWTLIGPQASEATLFRESPRLEATAIVHFLLHGVHLPDEERGSALLVYGGDGDDPSVLACDEIEQRLRLGGIVLLSSCGTALGPERLGDDNLANLGGAFLRAGARCVVLSRAPLEYGSVLGFMERVQRELQAGESPAEALRRARAAHAETETDEIEAFFDAQIQAVGLGHLPLPAATTESGRR